MKAIKYIYLTVRLKGLLAASLLLCGPSLQAIELKQNIEISDDYIYLSDIFKDGGDDGTAIILNAPAPGKSIKISGQALERIALKHNLDWQRPDYIRSVKISRAGNVITTEEMHDLLMEQALLAGAPDSANMRIFGRFSGIYLPLDKTLMDIVIDQFRYDANSQRFTTVLLIPQGGSEEKRVNISGRLQETVMVPMLAADIRPGHIISPSDITWQKMPKNRVNSRIVQDENTLLGKTVRRPIRGHKTLNVNDIMRPIAIASGTRVMMHFRIGSLKLTALGRALQDGGIGDTIRLMNLSSKKTIEGKIIHGNRIEVIDNNALILAAR